MSISGVLSVSFKN